MYKTRNGYKYGQRSKLNREILEYFPTDMFRLRYENMLSNCESFETQLTKISKAELLSQEEAAEGYDADYESLWAAESHLKICGRLKCGLPIPKNYFEKSCIVTVINALEGDKASIQELKRSCVLFILYNPSGPSNYIDENGYITVNELICAREHYKNIKQYPDPIRMPNRIAKLLKF